MKSFSTPSTFHTSTREVMGILQFVLTYLLNMSEYAVNFHNFKNLKFAKLDFQILKSFDF